MIIYEEINIWRRVDDSYVIRYTGFKNLNSGEICIVVANHLSDYVNDVPMDVDIFESVATSLRFLEIDKIPAAQWCLDLSTALAAFMSMSSDEASNTITE